MLCLSDTDIILKLAEYDAIPQALELLGVRYKDVRVLRRARRVITTTAVNHTSNAIQRALKLVELAEEIPNIDPKTQIILNGKSMVHRGRTISIDVGEAQIFATASQLPDARVCTGDKKCLRVLAAHPDCQPIATLLQHRVVCLERIVLGLIAFKGYGWMQDRVGKGVGDEAIAKAFGTDTGSCDESTCVQRLNIYESTLRGETGNLLVTTLQAKPVIQVLKPTVITSPVTKPLS